MMMVSDYFGVVFSANPVGIAVAMVVIPAICTNKDGDDMPLTVYDRAKL